MGETGGKPAGRRERNRQETHERIVTVGLKLFVEKGFEETTLDEIAQTAGIARRTLFSYFESKDDILSSSYGSGFSQALAPAIREESPDQAPLAAARSCLMKLASRYETPDSLAVDTLLRSSPALRARKSGSFDAMACSMLEAMENVWPAPDRRDELRLTATMAIGVLKLALEDWRKSAAERPLSEFIDRAFRLLPASLRLD
jgi:AcrR family transcriptional regulator